MTAPADALLEVRKKTYKMKSYDELCGGDWRRLTLNVERAANDLEQLHAVFRAMVSIVVPSARKHIPGWTDAEVMYAGAFVQTHLARACDEGAELMFRYTPAAVIIKERIGEIVQNLKEQMNG